MHITIVYYCYYYIIVPTVSDHGIWARTVCCTGIPWYNNKRFSRGETRLLARDSNFRNGAYLLSLPRIRLLSRATGSGRTSLYGETLLATIISHLLLIIT